MPLFYPIFTCLDPEYGSGSTKLLETDQIRIRIHNNVHRPEFFASKFPQASSCHRTLLCFPNYFRIPRHFPTPGRFREIPGRFPTLDNFVSTATFASLDIFVTPDNYASPAPPEEKTGISCQKGQS